MSMTIAYNYLVGLLTVGVLQLSRKLILKWVKTVLLKHLSFLQWENVVIHGKNEYKKNIRLLIKVE